MGVRNPMVWLLSTILVIGACSAAQGGISVQVSEKDGQQIEGAWVFVNVDDEEAGIHTQTDRTGSAYLTPPAEVRSLSLTVFKRGYYPETAEVTSEQSIPVKLEKVTRKATVRTLSLEGVSVPHVRIKVGKRTFQTNDQGIAEIVVDSLDSEVAVEIDSGCPGYPVESGTISFSEGEMSKELDFTLETVGVLRVQVVGPNGRALDGVRVIRGDHEIGLSDKDGRIDVSFCRGEEISLEKRCFKRLNPPLDGLSSTIRMKPIKTSLRGKVLWANGKPVANRTFFLNDKLLVRTNSEGVYEGRIGCEELPLESLRIKPAVDKGFGMPKAATAKVQREGDILNVADVTFVQQ